MMTNLMTLIKLINKDNTIVNTMFLNEQLDKSSLNPKQLSLVNDYPILEESDLDIARTTIFGLMDKDDYADDRAHIVDYCNNAAEDDIPFFYDMLTAVEFIPEGSTAYTTPDKRICLSYPCPDIVPMNSDRFRRWYFIYCHECLHQLWDTFNVGDDIKKDDGECDFELLNIASDCIINEYLTNIDKKGKLPPTNGITTDYIKDNYGVDFDIKTDTQRSLYDKLNKLNQKQKQSLKQKSQQSQGQSQGQSQQGAASGESDILTREIIETNRKKVEDILNKYKNSISGSLGEFVSKCKASKKKGGLIMNVSKGGSHWDNKLMDVCNSFMKQKIHNVEKQYKHTYSRWRRGEKAWQSTDNGRRILKKGKQVIKDQIGFDLAMYIDVSGSMSDCIDRVFDVAYDVIDTMIKRYGKSDVVDPKKVNTKAYTFDTKMTEIDYGKKCRAAGGTYSFHKLLSDIHERNVDAFINIVITDGEFNGVDDNEVVKLINDMDGLFVLITNQSDGYFEDLAKKVNSVGKQKKLVDIYADADFTV